MKYSNFLNLHLTSFISPSWLHSHGASQSSYAHTTAEPARGRCDDQSPSCSPRARPDHAARASCSACCEPFKCSAVPGPGKPGLTFGLCFSFGFVKYYSEHTHTHTPKTDSTNMMLFSVSSFLVYSQEFPKIPPDVCLAPYFQSLYVHQVSYTTRFRILSKFSID